MMLVHWFHHWTLSLGSCLAVVSMPSRPPLTCGYQVMAWWMPYPGPFPLEPPTPKQAENKPNKINVCYRHLSSAYSQ